NDVSPNERSLTSGFGDRPGKPGRFCFYRRKPSAPHPIRDTEAHFRRLRTVRPKARLGAIRRWRPFT
ncbi:MAG: hypothetical protein KDM63_07785, partial [Verrucomicrobiae bacterium]|nr:hypothetical protein [Verrucomicrobiae bacterium]